MGIIDFLKVKKGAPASQIAEMENQLERLRGELAKVNREIDDYGQARTELLLTDAADEVIADFDARHQIASIKQERLELAEYELLERIEAARNASDRSKQATQLERAADAILSKTAPIDQAAAAFAQAFGDLLSTLPADLIQLQARRLGHSVDVPATATDVATAIASQALASACPELFENRAPAMRSWGAAIERILAVKNIDGDGRLSPVLLGERGEQSTISTADKAADRIIILRLRAAAARLRDSTDMRQAAE